MSKTNEEKEYTFFAVPSGQPFVLTKEMQTDEMKKQSEENTRKFLETMKQIEEEKNATVKKKVLNKNNV